MFAIALFWRLSCETRRDRLVNYSLKSFSSRSFRLDYDLRGLLLPEFLFIGDVKTLKSY